MQDTRWGGGVYSSAEKQSVYSTAPADWEKKSLKTSDLDDYIWTYNNKAADWLFVAPVYNDIEKEFRISFYSAF